MAAARRNVRRFHIIPLISLTCLFYFQTLSRENDDLRAELGRLRQRQEKTDKELTSLKQENTNLLTEMSQLDCSREDLAERLQRQTHSLGKELQDSRAAVSLVIRVVVFVW